MKIVHIYDGHERVAVGQGSVPTIVYNLAKYTAREGHEVVVLERRWSGLSKEEEVDGISFRRINLRMGSNIPCAEVPYNQIKSLPGITRLIANKIEFAFKALGHLKRESFDVVHAHLPFAANVLVTLNNGLCDRMVYTAHVGEEGKRFGFTPSTPVLLRLFSPDMHLMRRSKRSVVLNEDLRRKLMVHKGIDPEKLKVIPNGIEVEEYGKFREEELDEVRKRYGLEAGVTVMFSGTITPRKGVKVLIRAGEAIIKRGYKDVLFLLCGNYEIDKDFTNEVVKYVNSKGLSKYFKFTGFVPHRDLRILYFACDAFVLPSFEEGFGLSLLEALASGKPVIGSDVGGIKMMIRDGWNGFLFRPGNDKELADKLEYLIENDHERRRMSINSRKLAEERFDWRIVVKQYIDVYEEVGVWKSGSS